MRCPTVLPVVTFTIVHSFGEVGSWFYLFTFWDTSFILTWFSLQLGMSHVKIWSGIRTYPFYHCNTIQNNQNLEIQTSTVEWLTSLIFHNLAMTSVVSNLIYGMVWNTLMSSQFSNNYIVSECHFNCVKEQPIHLCQYRILENEMKHKWVFTLLWSDTQSLIPFKYIVHTSLVYYV